ncbi:cation-transporting P-type ATPase [Pseudomonas sp. LFM046]|uniref:cation-transporting P-type ATPase n=1 Tax=Pseudomonas sp. LFM046 TaxID=1608357 RepID=UPI0005CFE93A|nr:cation-transporting P-type ATPase [Pseudomonas sp. LFM046]
MSVATQQDTRLDAERRSDRLSMRAAREAQNSLETTLSKVRSRKDGLDQADARARLQQDGPNEVAHDRPPHALVQLLQAFNNPFIIVRLCAGDLFHRMLRDYRRIHYHVTALAYPILERSGAITPRRSSVQGRAEEPSHSLESR